MVETELKERNTEQQEHGGDTELWEHRAVGIEHRAVGIELYEGNTKLWEHCGDTELWEHSGDTELWEHRAVGTEL